MTNHSANPLTALAIAPEKTSIEVQQKDETIEMLIRRHRVTNAPWILAAIIGMIVPIVIFSDFGRTYLGLTDIFELFSDTAITAVVGIWYLFIAFFALQHALEWFFNVLIVTNERFVDLDVHWPFYRFVSEAHFSQVQDVSFRQGGFASNFFDFGGVFIQTAGRDQNLEITKAPNPAMIHDKITDLVQDFHRKSGTRWH